MVSNYDVSRSLQLCKMLGTSGFIDFLKKEPRKVWSFQVVRLTPNDVILEVADNFFNRTNARLVATAFQRWQQVLITHQNASGYALKYDEAHLQSRMLLAWRMKLHDHLQMTKVARWANRYFVTRNAWRVWVNTLEERRRERKLRDFEITKLRKVYDGMLCVLYFFVDKLSFFKAWKGRRDQVQHFRRCEILLRDRIEKVRRFFNG